MLTHSPRLQSYLRLLARAAVTTIAVVLAGAAGQALAQQPGPKLRISYDGKNLRESDLETLKIIVLRPNVEQPVFLFVENPGEDPMKNVAVKLLQVLPNNTRQAVAEATIPLIDAGKYERVTFGKPAPALAKGKPVPWPELDGPPFRFEILVERPAPKGAEAPAPPALKIPVAIQIMPPSEYVKPDNPKYDPKTQTFSVDITATDKFFGPPASVELVLSPELIPGLIPKKVAGAYRQVLTRAGDKVPLVAEKLFFKGKAPEHGRIYVTVDGYERAFIFNNSFTEGAPTLISKGARARILAPRFAVPGDKCLVKVEVDDPPKFGGFVNFGFDRANNGQFAEEKLPGFRHQQIYFAPEGPKGGMVFLTTVQDWIRELDTADVFGARQLRVQLLEPKKDEQGRLTDQLQEVNLVDEIDVDPDRPEDHLPQPLHGPFAPLAFDAKAKAVLATIMLDGTPPENIRFVGWPKKLEKGSALLLQATAQDEESEISKVVFFIGPPVDGKMPPKAIEAPGKKVDPARAVWSGELPIPTEKPGKFEVSVQFTNGAGLAAVDTVVIELVEPKKSTKVGTTVKGKVFQGDLTPPDVAVTLVDDKGVIKATTKTDKTGAYVIEGVLPGVYRVVAVRSADKTQGQVALTVPEGTALIEGVNIGIARGP